MLPMVNPDPRLCPVIDHETTHLQGDKHISAAVFSGPAAEPPAGMASLSVGSLKWLAVRQNGWLALCLRLTGTVIHPPISCGA
jgi:hypothetical protein